MLGTGQSYEQLLLRMRAHPLPEARVYADMMLEELRKVIPSFLQRVDRADRGGVWSEYLTTTRRDTARIVEELFGDLVAPGRDHHEGPSGRATVELLDFDPDGEDKVIAAIVAPRTTRPSAPSTSIFKNPTGPSTSWSTSSSRRKVGTTVPGRDRRSPSSINPPFEPTCVE